MPTLASIVALLVIALAGWSSAPRLSPISIPTSEPVPWFGLGPTGCPTEDQREQRHIPILIPG